MTRRLCIGVSLAALVSVRAVSAQAPPPTVLVDVTVVDAMGQPVPDLAGDQFRIQVDGRARSVVAATGSG